MSGERELEDLRAELLELERSLRLEKEETSTILRNIFAVNDALGRALKADPGARAELTELQRCVNALTVGVKSADETKAMVALDSSLRIFGDMMEKRPQKNL